MAKTGTHFIASMFNAPLRCAHEPTAGNLIDILHKRVTNQLTQEQVFTYLSKRDETLQLDVDSSHINFFFIEDILHLFPQSRFILTVREPHDWANSFINDSRRNSAPEWLFLRQLRFTPWLYSYPSEEHVLKSNGLFPLDAYLNYWSRHNAKCLDLIPKENLMIINTSLIRQNANMIADFIRVDHKMLRLQHANQYSNSAKTNWLSLMDTEYVNHKIDYLCGGVLARLKTLGCGLT
jgi:hypothetical protein